MREHGTGMPRSAVALAGVLGALLVAGVIGLSVYSGGGEPAPRRPDTGPVALAPVAAPQARGGDCGRLVRALPRSMPSGDQAFDRRALARPAPPATAAWGDARDPVVLRCGLPEPAELAPTSRLLVVSGVQWLRVGGNAGRATYYAVDRPVYVALTLPATVGSGPLQDISGAIRKTLPAHPVRP